MDNFFHKVLGLFENFSIERKIIGINSKLFEAKVGKGLGVGMFKYWGWVGPSVECCLLEQFKIVCTPLVIGLKFVEALGVPNISIRFSHFSSLFRMPCIILYVAVVCIKIAKFYQSGNYRRCKSVDEKFYFLLFVSIQIDFCRL